MPMIPVLNYPDTDGARYSRTSVDLAIVATKTVGGVTSSLSPALRVEGWTSLSVKESLKPGKGWSHRSRPQTRTRGKYEPGGELGVYMEDYILIRRYLQVIGGTQGKGPFEQSFQLTATLFELALGTTRWDLLGCRIQEPSWGSEKENDDELEVKITLDVMNILLDGVSAVQENTPFGQIGVVVTV